MCSRLNRRLCCLPSQVPPVSHLRSIGLATVAVAAALLCGISPAHAQQPDQIRGRITGPDSQAIANAQITVVAISSNISKPTKTDKNGRFQVTFAGAEGDYWVNVAAVGFNPRHFEIKRMADEDVL